MKTVKVLSVVICANCSNYNWDQPKNKELMQRCSSCKLIYYCSKECQLEHWKKVHKHHCSFLAGTKVQSNIDHDLSQCRYCIKESEDPKINKSSGILGCPHHLIKLVDGVKCEYPSVDAPSPFKLGEITGFYECKVEHTLITAQRLLSKILQTESLMKSRFKAEFYELSRIFIKMRQFLRTMYCYLEPSNIKTESIFSVKGGDNLFSSNLNELDRNLSTIVTFIEEKRIKDKSRLVDSLVLFFRLIVHGAVFYDRVQDCTSNLGFMEVSKEYLSDKWDKVLSIMESDKWSYEKLKDVYCAEIKNRSCFGCDTIVPVPSQVTWLAPLMIDHANAQMKTGKYFRLGVPTLIICNPYPVLVVLCGRDTCSVQYGMIVTPLMQDFDCSPSLRCDTCFKFISSVHRCSGCLTKFYCGIPCRDTDWKIHRKNCIKDERKQKFGKCDRQIAALMRRAKVDDDALEMTKKMMMGCKQFK